VSAHAGTPTRTVGAAAGAARVGLVAAHGRGATADGLVDFLVAELGRERLASVRIRAPQARHGTWYPASFLAAFEVNQPWLDAALDRIGAEVAALEADGIERERIVIFGFSQGACLASEWVARNPARYGALVAATGARIGPPGTRFETSGDLAGTPVHLSAGDPDPHVPWARVEETAANLRAMGAAVTSRREPGFAHGVHPEAAAFLRERIDVLSGAGVRLATDA